MDFRAKRGGTKDRGSRVAADGEENPHYIVPA
jgi:hypothetical protein